MLPSHDVDNSQEMEDIEKLKAEGELISHQIHVSLINGSDLYTDDDIKIKNPKKNKEF